MAEMSSPIHSATPYSTLLINNCRLQFGSAASFSSIGSKDAADIFAALRLPTAMVRIEEDIAPNIDWSCQAYLSTMLRNEDGFP